MSLTAVPPGHLAAIVTTLEMRGRPRPAPMPTSMLRLARWTMPKLDTYRALFRRVGEPWLWFSRLVLTDEALAAIIHDPLVEIFAVLDRQGIEVGIIELDFRVAGECELGFFGLIRELGGKGHGRWMMAQAKSLAWRKGVERFWVHTCTLDAPSAIGFYRKSGLVPIGLQVEIFADPRLTGHLSRDCAPQIPLLG